MQYEAQTRSVAIWINSHRFFFTFKNLKSEISMKFHFRVTLYWNPYRIWDKPLSKSGIFENPANFEDLYLRVYWIFFKISKDSERYNINEPNTIKNGHFTQKLQSIQNSKISKNHFLAPNLLQGHG